MDTSKKVIGEGEELWLGGVDRPGVPVEPSSSHGVLPPRNLLEFLAIEAIFWAHFASEGEANGLEVLYGLN